MATPYLHTVRRFGRDVRLYLIASMLFGFSLFGGIYALLLNLYLLRLSYGPEFVGLVNAVGALSFALFSLPAGVLGVRRGSRCLMVAGIGASAIGHGLLSQAELIPYDLRAAFILATYAFGLLGVAFYVVNGAPYLMDVTGPEARNHAFSIQGALFPLAGFAGSLFGGFLPGRLAALLNTTLDHPAPYRYTLLAASALLIPALFILLATREGRGGQTREVAPGEAAFPLGLIALASCISLLHVAGEGAVRTFFNVYLDAGLNAPTSLIGTLAAAGQLLAVPAALAVPLLTGRFGNHRTVLIGALGSTLMLVPMALFAHWTAAGICFAGIIGLAAMRRPAFIVFNQELVPARWRAAMSGASSMMSGIGYSAIALGGGYTIAAAGYRTLFLAGAAFTALGALIFWACFRTPRGEFARRAERSSLSKEKPT